MACSIAQGVLDLLPETVCNLSDGTSKTEETIKELVGTTLTGGAGDGCEVTLCGFTVGGEII